MTPTQRIALTYGLVCHLSFALAVGLMAWNLYGGMNWQLLPLEGPLAYLSNFLLVLQFPLLHSYLLTDSGRGLLAKFSPKEHGSTLATTVFATIASLQLILVFCLWSPMGSVLWQASGLSESILQVLFALSWLFLARSMYDAGLSLQSGSLGWVALFRGKRPQYNSFPTQGTFKYCRQPIYLAFALILWTGPVWTHDKLFISVVWTLYSVLGPVLKERRYARRYGDAFKGYQSSTPYMLPELSLTHENLVPVKRS